jgi:hypothetical protein
LALKIAKQYYGPPHDDLLQAAIQGLYEGIKRYKLSRNDCPRLGAFAVYYIREEVRKEVRRWCKSGDSSQTRVDRWVHDHPSATLDEVIAAAGSTLKLKRGLSRKAQAAIDRADACRNGHDSIDKIDCAFDEAGNHVGPKFGTSHRLHGTGHELYDEYDQLSPYHLSPQLAPSASGDADELLRSALNVDELPKDVEQQLQTALTEDDDEQAKERLKEIRKRPAGDVERRDKPRIAADPNLYRTKTSLRDRMRIAARSHEPIKLLGPRRFDGKKWVRSQPAVAGLEQFRQAQPRKRPHWTFQEGSQRSLGNTPVMDVAGWGPKKKASEVRTRLEPSHRIHKQAAREQINKLVPEYLSSGGEIAQCPRDPKLDDSRKPTLAELQRYQQVLDRYCNQDRSVSCEPPQSRQPEKEKAK